MGEGLGYLEAIETISQKPPARGASELPMLAELRVDQAHDIALSISRMRKFIEERGRDFDFSDCSVGNLILGGLFLEHGNDFNAATHAFAQLVGARGRVLNVTRGENFVLVGLKEDGTFLRNEAAIVSPQSGARLRDIYLLPNYLGADDQARLEALSPDETHAALRRLEVFPQVNPEVEQALREADIIVYGPGTQHSSLFPSYFTEGVGEAIARTSAPRRSSSRIFVAITRFSPRPLILSWRSSPIT